MRWTFIKIDTFEDMLCIISHNLLLQVIRQVLFIYNICTDATEYRSPSVYSDWVTLS